MAKILIVDDDQTQVDILKEVLDNRSHDIIGASTEREVLEALDKTKFDKGIFDWWIETPFGQPKKYWESVIRKAADSGMKDMVFNTATDDSSGKLRPLMNELRNRGIKVGELDKMSPAKEFFEQVRREIG